jgi:hypothetical protein
LLPFSFIFIFYNFLSNKSLLNFCNLNILYIEIKRVVKNFKDFVNEGKLIIEDEMTFDQEVNWEKTVDISKLWKDFEKGQLDLNSYNTELALKLEDTLEDKINYFKDIIKELKQNKTQEESYSLWNKLYDKADQNLIELKI